MRIRSKTILGIALIELSLLSLLVIGTLHTLRQSNEDELMRRVSLSEKLLVASAKDALIAHDFATLDDIVADMLQTGQFVYLRFIDDEGFTMREGGDGELLKRAFTADKSLQETIDDNIFDKHVFVSVAKINYGEVQFGISVKPLDELLTQTWQWAIAVALLNILLVALFSWLLGSYLVRQLMVLRDASRRFAAGDLNYRIPIKGKDELAETTETFNNMAGQLEMSHQQLFSEIAERKKMTEKLQQANTNLAHFTNIAAHHLQEPPRRLISFVQRLKTQLNSELLTKDAAMSLMFIEQSATRQRALTKDIQRFLASENPQGIVEKSEFQPLLKKAQQDHAQLIEDLNATITIHSLPPLMIDKPRLYDICYILLDNALYYHHPDRPLEIEIKSESKAKKNYYYFMDNGVGIPKQHYERVFQVFERLQINDDQNRTGIGLALVKRIIESCNGRIFLQENISGGITVVLEFPQIIKYNKS
ncbi:MAG: HAMP domain-containing protein [Methylococcaceae bacterium]|nr:HAMP domain-containing protein [Methylococcaceae bacterium]